MTAEPCRAKDSPLHSPSNLFRPRRNPPSWAGTTDFGGGAGYRPRVRRAYFDAVYRHSRARRHRQYKRSGPNYKGECRNLAAIESKVLPLPIKDTFVALLRLFVGLVTIALLTISIFSLLAGLVLALDQAFVGPAGSLPGTRLLRALTGVEPSGVMVGLVVSVLAYVSLSLAVLAEARLVGHSEWRDLFAWTPWNPMRTDRRVYLVAAAALAYGFAADLALHYLHPPSNSWLVLPDDPVDALVLTFVAVACAPVAEELLFRGFVYTDLRRHFSLATTLVVTSAVFAWLHYESTHLYALVVFPIGLALGAMREIAGSVKPAIAFHALNNLLATGLAYLGF
jgi:membrane protease YdiL (CAAX protease family)